MIHCLFNNIFMESNNNINNSLIREQASDNNKGFLFPISGDNEHILLYLIDLYEKVIIIYLNSHNNYFLLTKFLLLNSWILQITLKLI